MGDALYGLLLVALVMMFSARLARLLAVDRILDPARTPAQTWFEHRWADRNGFTHADVDAEEVWLSRGAYFLGCPWCQGVWAAGAVTLVTDMVVGLPVPVLVWGAAAWFAGRHGGK